MKYQFKLSEKFIHPRRHLLHRPIIREQDKGITVGLPDEMFDPMRQRFFITRVPRVGHFADDKQFHLLIKIEWAAELKRLGFFRTHASAEIGQVFSPYP